MPPEQQTPPEEQHPAPSVDDLIAQANAQAYSFHYGDNKKRRSPKEWFLRLPKTQKILLLAGVGFVLFAGTAIGLTNGSTHNTPLSSQISTVATTDSNGDGTIDQSDVASFSGDTNGDGVVDSRDDAAANTTDSESASWWGNLFEKAKGAISSKSTSSSADEDDAVTTSSSTTNVAVAEEQEEQENATASPVPQETTKPTTPTQSPKTPTPTSPVITLSGVNNFRDAAASSAGLMKSGVLYRSAKLQDATSSDRAKLASLLKNGVIVDMRTVKVRSGSPDGKVSGVTNLNFPVTGVSSADGYVKAFVSNAADRKQLGAAITKIADTKGNALIHCTAGKDRTGWMVAMIMYSIGASDKQVMTEYLKSKEYGMEVDSAWLNAALKAAKKNNGGSIITYIKSKNKGLGVSDATIVKLKTKFSAK